MNIDTLKELLAVLAEKDLSADANLHDHPCSVAVRAIDSYRDDASFLRGIVNGRNIKTSKRAITLLKMGCNDNF